MMKLRPMYGIVLTAVMVAATACVAAETKQQIFVHYMPWYASKAVSGHWGWHWTMNKFDADSLTDGRREIASHDYPLMGLYDSNDPDALQCHVLLMKLAGIDGVIIDWYGSEDFRDYKSIHRNTLHLIKHIKKAGLQFAICYEDQTVKHMIAGNALPRDQDIAHGTKVIQWMNDHWFSDPAYAKIDGRPLLLVFGPQHFQQSAWQTMLADLSPRPLLYALPHLTKQSGADGAFGWPPVAGGNEIVPTVWRSYLAKLDARSADQGVIATAFPGFRDIYQQAGVGESHGSIDDRDGATLNETLQLAAKSKAPIIQVATWNDYGEGTMVEPTVRRGYQYLESIQSLSAKYSPERNLKADDLRLPIRLYELKKTHAGDAVISKELMRAAERLRSQQCDRARAILTAIDQDR